MTISYLTFCYRLLSPQALFSDTGYDDTDQIAKVRREVNEVKGVMTQNIGNGFIMVIELSGVQFGLKSYA